MKDYVSYIDTDSLFLMIGDFLKSMGISEDQWDALDQSVRTEYTIKIAKVIETDINDRAYHETQLNDYNSVIQEDDFSIKFKQEIYCPNALFLAPKMYAFHVLNEEGFPCDKIDAKGVETVRSSAPTVFRNALKKVLERLLKGDTDKQLSDLVNDFTAEFYNAKPEDISVNIGVNGISRYVEPDYSYRKGTPYHLKGTAHYHYLLQDLELTHKYENIREGDKVKLVYLKKNKYGFNNIAFYKYPKEFFDNGILVDYDIMIEKYFTNKAMILLDPINKAQILHDNSIEDLFF